MPRLLILRMLEYGWLLGRNWWGHELLSKCISFQKFSQIDSSASFHASWLRISSSLWNSVDFYIFFLLPLRMGHLNWTLLSSASILLLSIEWIFHFGHYIFQLHNSFWFYFIYFFFSLLILSIWWYNVLILSLSSFYMVSLVLWYFKQLIWCLCLVSPMSGLPRRQFPLIAFFFFLACAWVFLSCYFPCFIIFGWNLDILNN